MAIWPLLTGAQTSAGTGTVNPAASSEPPLLSPSNLLAWCIVPFDKNQRGPAERVAMLKRLGFTQYAWDWRKNHLQDLPAEIRLSREAGIRIRAVWLWIEGGSDQVGRLSEGNRAVMDAVREAGLPVEYWVGFHPNFFAQLDEPARIQHAADMMTYLRAQAARSGSTVAFYNHGDWIGEPDNQIKVIKAMGGPDVGLVFNFHHAHGMIDDFPALVGRMRPYLRAVNLNGMEPHGPKILPVGQGTRERGMLRSLLDSGYTGPVGLLGHVDNEDVESVLRRNLAGVRQLARELAP
ncbi:MAG: sugar phosphate isomerase/epimerase family protein [Verrucomicrobiota bacterium]